MNKKSVWKRNFCLAGRGMCVCIVLVLAFVVTSCENFLEGSNFKSQLESDIAYSKAEQFYVKVGLLKNEYGSITPLTEQKYRATDKINIEFSISSLYGFNGFKIIDKDTRVEDTSGAITLSDITETTVGISTTYKVTATINFLKENLMITPNCFLRNDTTPPIFFLSTESDENPALKLSRNKSELEQGKYIKKQQKGNFDISWIFEKETCQSRHVSSLYIKASIKEEDNVPEYITVTENFFSDSIHSDSGTVTFGDIEPGEVNAKEVPLKLQKSDDGLYEVEFLYEFATTSALKKDKDGLFRLDFTITDSAGNETETPVSFYILKDTYLDVTGIKFYNHCPYYNGENFYEGYTSDKTQYQNVYKTIFVDLEAGIKDLWGFCTTDSENFTYSLKWGADKEHLSSTSEFGYYWDDYGGKEMFGAVLGELDEDIFNLVILEITDEAGVVSTIEKWLPPKPQVISLEKNPEHENFSVLTFRSYTDETNDFSSICPKLVICDEYSIWEQNGANEFYSNYELLYAYLAYDDEFCGPLNCDLSSITVIENGDFSVPSFNLKVSSKGAGLGLYNVQVVDSKEEQPYLEKYGQNEEITYYFSVEQGTSKSTFIEDSFNVNYSADSYNFRIIAVKNGKEVKSDPYTITETQIDNKAPQTDESYSNLYEMMTVIKNPKIVNIYYNFTDDSFKTENPCELHYSDYKTEWNGAIKIYDNTQITNLPYVDLTVQALNKQITSIPVPIKQFTKDGNYLIAVKIYDSAENPNFAIAPVGIAHIETIEPPIIEKFSTSEGNKTITCALNENLSTQSQEIYIMKVFYWKDATWKLNGNQYSDERINMKSKTGSEVLDSDAQSSFIKTYLYAYTKDTELYGVSAVYNGEYYTSCQRKREAFSAPVYKMFSEVDIACYSKAIIETSTKTVILNDQPVFVHLVTACADYGTDIAKWERFGDFFDETVIDPSVTGQTLNTFDFDINNVNSGEYYVTIAWFADGTSDISSVRQK